MRFPSCRPQVRFLPGAPSYFSRLHLLQMYPAFSFGAHLVPTDSIFAPVLFRPLLCAPASVALLVRPHKHTRSGAFYLLAPPLLPLKGESPKPIQRKLSAGVCPRLLRVLLVCPKDRGQRGDFVLAHPALEIFLKFENHASFQPIENKRRHP